MKAERDRPGRGKGSVLLTVPGSLGPGQRPIPFQLCLQPRQRRGEFPFFLGRQCNAKPSNK